MLRLLIYYSKRNISVNVILIEVITIRDNIRGGALTETTFLILLALYQPNHGYGIMQFIEQQTGGRVVLGAGTLYGALQALVKKKWISPLPADVLDKKKEYVITGVGKQKAEEELQRMEEVVKQATTIIRGGKGE